MRFIVLLTLIVTYTTCQAQDSLSFKENLIEEVTVSGSMRPVSKFESTVPVEVYSASFLKMNPSSSFYEALQFVNGIRPQSNCSICNTGDIHINGQEGANTLVLIDGIPVMSGLASVYALNGIPSSIVEKVELIRGPASALYGSEATGGVINIITKRIENAPRFSTEFQGTTWGEFGVDMAATSKLNDKNALLGSCSYYLYQIPMDKNKDRFTDVALQNRFSGFTKYERKLMQNKRLVMTGRYNYEYRWGGELDWEKKYRGTDVKYAEVIETQRWEFGFDYEIPMKESLKFQCNASGHYQNSDYGTLSFDAKQHTFFAQSYYTKSLPRNTLIAGITYRLTQYNDNTPATSEINLTSTLNTHRFGIFLQDEIQMHKSHILLLGLRVEHHPIHKAILSPRINYKWTSKEKKSSIGLSAGNGFRIVNVFTEDHAALSGARELVFLSNLKPEQNWNAQFHFTQKISANTSRIEIDASAFYTYYSNKIVADYDQDPGKIVYDNLSGYAISRGVQSNLSVVTDFGLRIMCGMSLLDAYSVENKIKERQYFSERFTATWTISQRIKRWGVQIDYSGNVYSPMRLPLLSDSDPRPGKSPWWSIQNVQVSKKFKVGVEIFAGVKNLLDFVPWRGLPFLIARSEDPFNKNVSYDSDGKILKTTENPYGINFDPSYVFTPNQGIRGFVGLRYELK